MKYFPRLFQSDGLSQEPRLMKNCVLSPDNLSGYLIVNEFVEENILHLHSGIIIVGYFKDTCQVCKKKKRL